MRNNEARRYDPAQDAPEIPASATPRAAAEAGRKTSNDNGAKADRPDSGIWPNTEQELNESDLMDVQDIRPEPSAETASAMQEVLDASQQRMVEDAARQDFAKLTDADFDRIAAAIEPIPGAAPTSQAEFTALAAERAQEFRAKMEANLGPDGKPLMSGEEAAALSREYGKLFIEKARQEKEQRAIEKAKADLAAITPEEIDAAVERMDAPAMEGSEVKNETLLRTEMARLDQVIADAKDGPQGWSTLEAAINMKYGTNMAAVNKGFFGKLGSGLRSMVDGEYRAMVADYRSKVDAYNAAAEERAMLDLQVNDPEAFAAKMTNRANRSVAKPRGGSGSGIIGGGGLR